MYGMKIECIWELGWSRYIKQIWFDQKLHGYASTLQTRRTRLEIYVFSLKMVLILRSGSELLRPERGAHIQGASSWCTKPLIDVVAKMLYSFKFNIDDALNALCAPIPYSLIVDAYRLSPRIESLRSPWDSIREFDAMYGEKRIHRSGIILVEHPDIKRTYIHTYRHTHIHIHIHMHMHMHMHACMHTIYIYIYICARIYI